MHLTALSYIGQEEDIVEVFVRHTLRFADELIVISTADDTTRALLHTLEVEGLSLRVIDHQPAYHDQQEMLSNLLGEVSPTTDWILPLDADEFVMGDISTALE